MFFKWNIVGFIVHVKAVYSCESLLMCYSDDDVSSLIDSEREIRLLFHALNWAIIF